MVERALSFGAVASAYERFRPGYPDRLVDEIEAYAGRPLRTALEIGAGTGKATRVLAARGIAVTATDPDAAMLAELRRHVPATVTTVRASFEELPLDRTHDLVLAAAALHWTRPADRWSRIAALPPAEARSSWPTPTSMRPSTRLAGPCSPTTASPPPTARPRTARCSGRRRSWSPRRCSPTSASCGSSAD